MSAVTRAPSWTRGGEDPIPAVRVRLLLCQRCMKEFPDPVGFNSRWRVAVNWEGRQPCCCGDHVLQRVSIMTRWYWHILRRGRAHPGRPHHLRLNRVPRPGHYDPWRVTRPCTWRVEEVSWIVNRRESRLGLLSKSSRPFCAFHNVHSHNTNALFILFCFYLQQNTYCCYIYFFSVFSFVFCIIYFLLFFSLFFNSFCF